MAERSVRTRRSGNRHTKAEMNRNREASFGGAMTTRRQGASDSPGASSSRGRSRKSGADRAGSVQATRGGSGTPGGAARSVDASPRRSGVRGKGINPPAKGTHIPETLAAAARPKRKRTVGKKKTRTR